MKTTKTTKAIYWTTTVIIFLFEGVMPALTSQTEMAKQGIQHLGYPQYFGNAFVIFKVIGTLVLIIPQIPNRIKEWAYAGFAFDFIFACISICAVDGFSFMAFFPLIILAILIASYITHEKIIHSKNYSSDSKTNNYTVSGSIA
jgi:DoxX-like protein